MEKHIKNMKREGELRDEKAEDGDAIFTGVITQDPARSNLEICCGFGQKNFKGEIYSQLSVLYILKKRSNE